MNRNNNGSRVATDLNGLCVPDVVDVLRSFCTPVILNAQRTWLYEPSLQCYPSPRVSKIIEDTYAEGQCYNYCSGTSSNVYVGHNYELFVDAGKPKTMVLLIHHDIVNPNTVNVNDNTASIAHGIVLYHRWMAVRDQLKCNVRIAFCDGEELVDMEKAGSVKVGERLLNFGFNNENICGIFAPELTACGNRYWYNPYGQRDTDLIKVLCGLDFNKVSTLCNDANYIHRVHGLNAVCLGSFRDEDYQQVLVENQISCDLWNTCHRSNDTVDWINEDDMLKFNDMIYSLAFKLGD